MGFFECCNICLQTNNLISVNALDTNRVKWSSKINFICPELDATDDYLICTDCTKKLDDFSAFKRLLIDLLKRLKNALKSVEENPLQKNFSENVSNQSKQHFDCDSFVPKGLNAQRNHEDNLREKIVQTQVQSAKDSQEALLEFNSKPVDIESANFQSTICNKISTSSVNFEKRKQNCGSEIITKEKSKQRIKRKGNDLIKDPRPRGRKTKFIVSCEICAVTFSYIKPLLEHCVNNHAMEAKHVKPYKCSHCENRFTTHTTLIQHIKYHEKKRSEICTICGKTFITANDLLVHEYTHLNKRNYKCTQCDKAFNTNKNLRTHILVVHTDRSLWKYHCSVCGKKFPLKVNFDQHCRRHNGEKFHICHFCGKSFVSNSELKRHVELHSNIKRFHCIPCNKDYKSRRTYKVHMDSKHSDGQSNAPIREKKFICHICPSQFYDKPKLLRHLCSHSGLKPFGCSICGKRFTDKSYLKHHIKIGHQINEPTVYSINVPVKQ